MESGFTVTSESVTEGHPDKVADQISDAVLDCILAEDKDARVACETFVTTGTVIVGGEISTKKYVNLRGLVQNVVKEIGYVYPEIGFFYKHLSVINIIHEQSPDIAEGVNQSSIAKQGAGDQGVMFGYAINETKEYMPLPITLAHALTKNVSKLRKSKKIGYLRPDGKSQVSIHYKDGKPQYAKKVLLAVQHTEDVTQDKIKEDMIEQLIEPTLGEYYSTKTEVLVNGTGKFIIGGPHGDAGLTGRKIIVDTYGGAGYHGGGAFSGKDPSKVDRTGSYAARYIARNIVSAGLAEKVNVQIAYSIGIAEPFSFRIDTCGTGKLLDTEIAEKVKKLIDLKPGELVARLDLKNAVYQPLAAYGHFGRPDLDLTWEKDDLF